eukprot:TRINITY_DN6211_c0_g1_i1.p1 TRINITY_DN6211_c0_g1~~TRINITY_DN6211_c0_g1_i1.p1  ORF type:complete len:334 (-),score=68.37 TRINITY_DN6211_c0_g1_i1:260-1261(-)
MIRRPPRSTQGVSSAASDVYKRQVSTQSTWGIKVRKYLGHALEEKKNLQMDEREMMAAISTPLRDELTIFFHGTILHNCPVFYDFPPDFLSYLTFFMHTDQFSIGDTIFEEEEASNKMYFIVKGKVLVYTRLPLAALAELGEDEIFGELGFFGNLPRSASVESLAFTQCLSISHEGMQKAAGHFPSTIDSLKEIFDEINNGCFSSLQLKCYYCNECDHIAPNCPHNLEYVDERNKKFKCELYIIKQKLVSNVEWDAKTPDLFNQKIAMESKDTPKYSGNSHSSEEENKGELPLEIPLDNSNKGKVFPFPRLSSKKNNSQNEREIPVRNSRSAE